MKRRISPEIRGVLGLMLVILVVGAVMAASSGKLEQWFGITLLSGPKALDKIVFVSDRDGTEEIYAMNPDGTGQTRLTQNGHVYSMPAISPSGTRITYVGRFGSQDQVFAVGAKGGTADRLTSATGPKKLPCHSPDGTKLSFIASGRVYVADINGDSPQPVLPTRGQLHEAMSNPLMRNQAPAYYDYAWQRDSVGMMGVTRDAVDSDVLVYLPRPDGESKIIPPREVINQLLGDSGAARMRIRPEERVRISGIDWAGDADVFAATVTVARGSFLLMLAIEDGTLKIVGFRPLEGQKAGRPGVSPNGTSVVVATRSFNGKAANGILVADLQSGSGHMVAGGLYEDPTYSPDGTEILATLLKEGGTTKDVVVIDPSSGEVRKLTSDGHSHSAIWTPASAK